MQFLILLLGAMVFLFYQFEKPPMFFNQPTYQRAIERGYGPQLTALQSQFDDVFARKRDAMHAIASAENSTALTAQIRELDATARGLREDTKNILGSVFYGSILGLFLVAFFLPNVRGSAVFFAAVIAQTLVLVLFFTSSIGYLWFNVIGCAAVLLFAWILQRILFRKASPR